VSGAEWAHGFAPPPYDGFTFVEDEEVSATEIPQPGAERPRRHGHATTVSQQL
jgi:hypothetical protein